MKPTAFLINTCGGDVVDQESYKEVLKNERIAGAALEVFIKETPTDIEFLSLPNLIVTPHIDAIAIQSVEAKGRSGINHLVSLINKKILNILKLLN
jgi:D-3-phosphoglycerate dehydrogenase / 2-oxoglutarate reductase